jgi:hypothetical protein
MANIKISQLPSVTSLSGTEEFPMVSTGLVTSQVTSSVILNYVNGNITSLGTLSTLSATGNITGGNIRTAGQVSATGNISGNYFIGNGSQLSGLPATYGNSNVNTLLASWGSNTISTTGTITSGNITGGNVLTGGLISAVSTITSAANITGGNVLTGGLISAVSTITSAANITGGNVSTGGQVSATGNVSGNYLRSTIDTIVGGNISTTNLTGTGVSVTANVSGGNIRTVGQVSASGNITGNYILGNGSQLTGIGSSYGDSNVATFLAAFGSNTITTTGNISGGNVNATTHTGTTVSVSGTITGGNILAGSGIITTTGNVLGGNILAGSGIITTTGNISGANVNATTHTGTTVSVTGNITGANLSIGNIVTTGNTVSNIGSLSNQFNTVFALATSAQYADLAENYQADAEYSPGTVVVFGGDKEITVTTELADERVAGVVSTNPAYLMNSGESGLPIALRGKVPVRVVGLVAKGDSLVTSTTPGVAISVGRDRTYAQAVFAKSLESNTTDNEKVILAVIV